MPETPDWHRAIQDVLCIVTVNVVNNIGSESPAPGGQTVAGHHQEPCLGREGGFP